MLFRQMLEFVRKAERDLEHMRVSLRNSWLNDNRTIDRNGLGTRFLEERYQWRLEEMADYAIEDLPLAASTVDIVCMWS